MPETFSPERASVENVNDRPSSPSWPGRPALVLALCGVWFLLGIAFLFTGPILSSHETIVAQIARQTLQSGDWIVPRYLDAPFLVKPPLSPWLAAGSGLLLPADNMTGLPVSTAAARLPSLLATLMTMLVLYALANSMFGRGVGLCTAFIYATSAGVLVFALNATAEAVLTCFCAWAFAEFWWSRQTVGGRKRIHQIRFFLALALGMFAKAPMPLLVVAVPLAAWWWLEPSLRLLGDEGLKATGGAAKLFGRGLPGRTRLALTDLGLWWGIPTSLALLVAWLWAASREVPYIWRLWDTEYLHRLSDEVLWVEAHGTFYYLPILLGLVAPWTLSLPEALASPFLRRYQGQREPILYAWFWVVSSVLILSAMHFKQDYYLVPVLPGCALLLGPVLHALFFASSGPPSRAVARLTVLLVGLAVIAVPIASFVALRGDTTGWGLGDPFIPVVLIGTIIVAGAVFAARQYLAGRGPSAFVAVGVMGFAVFGVIWIAEGSDKHQLREYTALVDGLRQANVDENEDVFWADSVPDGRATFYGNRRIRQLGDPFELRAGVRGQDRWEIMMTMASKICRMLEGKRVYFVFDRDRYSLLKSISRPKATVLFEVDRGTPGPDEDDWLVVTNAES